MAVRYSGDAEVRVWWDARAREYHGHVRDPYVRVPGKTTHRGRAEPTSSEAYDAAALALLKHADHVTRGRVQVQRRGGRIVLQRGFQAPCPVSRR